MSDTGHNLSLGTCICAGIIIQAPRLGMSVLSTASSAGPRAASVNINKGRKKSCPRGGASLSCKPGQGGFRIPADRVWR